MSNHPHNHGHDGHHRDHSHGHHHGLGRGARNKTQLWRVLILSTIYMVCEATGGWLSGSLALLADAGHMLVDATAVGLGLFAIWIAQKPATHAKTYGYYRAEILAALANGATLVVVSIWIIFEAWHRFMAPQPVQGPLMAAVAAGGLLINVVQLVLLRDRTQHDLNVHGVWLHLVTDTMGTASALVAAVLVWAYGWNLADPILSVVIAVLILFGSWQLLSECVNVLLEGVPKGVDVGAIKTAIEADADVRDVHDLHVWMVSSGVNALSAHVRLKDKVDPSAVLEKLTRILREKHLVDHVTIQLEPASFAADQCHTLHCAQK